MHWAVPNLIEACTDATVLIFVLPHQVRTPLLFFARERTRSTPLTPIPTPHTRAHPPSAQSHTHNDTHAHTP
jgi:hypothetical protein